jgi:hypothetical protein
MPKGPRGQKRPADTVANAIRVAKILTGEIEEDTRRFGQGQGGPGARSKGRSGASGQAQPKAPGRNRERGRSQKVVYVALAC